MEGLRLVLIAVCSLAAVALLIKLFATLRKRRGERREGLVVERRHIGSGWRIALRGKDFPVGLRIGRAPSPPPPDLVPLRNGRAAWGPGARRRLREGTPLHAALESAEGDWSLADGVLDSWLRDIRPTQLERRAEARIVEGLGLARLLRHRDPG